MQVAAIGHPVLGIEAQRHPAGAIAVSQPGEVAVQLRIKVAFIWANVDISNFKKERTDLKLLLLFLKS